MTIFGALGFFAAGIGIGNLLAFSGIHFFSSSAINSAGISPRHKQSSIVSNFARWRIKRFLLAMYPLNVAIQAGHNCGSVADKRSVEPSDLWSCDYLRRRISKSDRPPKPANASVLGSGTHTKSNEGILLIPGGGTYGGGVKVTANGAV